MDGYTHIASINSDSPVCPEVGGYVGVEVRIAVIQGQGEGQQETAQHTEAASLLLQEEFCEVVNLMNHFDLKLNFN